MALIGEMTFRDLGRTSYEQAMVLQRRTHAGVLAGDSPPVVLLTEHDPVVTVTKRPSARTHLLAEPKQMASEGIDVVRTDRGGDVTYHGPGQLVAYPIVPLKHLRMNLRTYVRSLEQAMIRTLGRWSIEAVGNDKNVGVWVGPAKIGAIGVRVERWVTMHGLALNVDPDLRHYRWIVPCGLTAPVTSMRKLLADRCPSMSQVKEALAESLQAVWS